MLTPQQVQAEHQLAGWPENWPAAAAEVRGVVLLLGLGMCASGVLVTLRVTSELVAEG